MTIQVPLEQKRKPAMRSSSLGLGSLGTGSIEYCSAPMMMSAGLKSMSSGLEPPDLMDCAFEEVCLASAPDGAFEEGWDEDELLVELESLVSEDLCAPVAMPASAAPPVPKAKKGKALFAKRGSARDRHGRDLQHRRGGRACRGGRRGRDRRHGGALPGVRLERRPRERRRGLYEVGADG